MSELEPKLWEFHIGWDTPTSFERFRKYYLNQHPPRSYIEAFKLFRTRESGWSRKRVALIRDIDGRWGYWSQGKTSKGEQIDGCPTWKERAIAYDVFLISAFDEAKATRRVKYLERTLERTDQIESKWDEMFEIAKILRKTGIKKIPIIQVGADGTEKTEWLEVEIKKLNVNEFRNLIGALNDGDKLIRRTLGMAEEIRQNQIGDADGNAVDMGSGLVDILAGAFQSFQKNKFDKEETDATD